MWLKYSFSAAGFLGISSYAQKHVNISNMDVIFILDVYTQMVFCQVLSPCVYK